ncbi:MAG: O-antigen ligase family protein [Candidatus Andersenbacteria bacterium]
MITLSPLLLFSLVAALGLLPLQNTTLPFFLPVSRLWNDLGWLLLLVLVFIFGARLKTIGRDMSNWSVRVVVLGILFFLLLSIAGHGTSAFLLHATEVIAFGVLFINLVPTQRIILVTTLIGVLSIFAQWGVGQFIVQHDFNFQHLGESQLTSALPGVAKFASSYSDGKLIRGYGPYPHANPYSGAALSGLILVPWLLSHVRGSKDVSLTSATGLSLIMMFALAVAVSFSRAGILGLFLWLVITATLRQTREVLQKILGSIVVAFLAIALVFSPLFVSRISDSEDKAVSDRSLGLVWSLNIIREHPFWGVGPGQYRSALKEYLDSHDESYMSWQIAPVHSVPFLLLSEHGLILGGALILIILSWFIARHRSALLFMAPLLPLLLLDHFYYTQTFFLILLLIVAHTMSHTRFQLEGRR